jgi:hypothetical protein
VWVAYRQVDLHLSRGDAAVRSPAGVGRLQVWVAYRQVEVASRSDNVKADPCVPLYALTLREREQAQVQAQTPAPAPGPVPWHIRGWALATAGHPSQYLKAPAAAGLRETAKSNSMSESMSESTSKIGPLSESLSQEYPSRRVAVYLYASRYIRVSPHE